MKSQEKGGARAVLPDKLINIWISDLDPNIGSYATSPFQDVEDAGIVIDQRLFGKEQKSLTHLMGNYLGLKDLWHEYEPCGDDLVSDTPISNAPNRGKPKFKHITTCVRNRLVPEMTMNYMDSTDDDLSLIHI